MSNVISSPLIVNVLALSRAAVEFHAVLVFAKLFNDLHRLVKRPVAREAGLNLGQDA